MKAVLQAILRFILGRYAPAWAKAVEAGQQAYVAEVKDEQAQAVAAVQEREQGIDAETAEEQKMVADIPDTGTAAVMDGVFANAAKHNQGQPD